MFIREQRNIDRAYDRMLKMWPHQKSLFDHWFEQNMSSCRYQNDEFIQSRMSTTKESEEKGLTLFINNDKPGILTFADWLQNPVSRGDFVRIKGKLHLFHSAHLTQEHNKAILTVQDLSNNEESSITQQPQTALALKTTFVTGVTAAARVFVLDNVAKVQCEDVFLL